MNKAFVREPEDDGRAFCPQCGSLGTAVGSVTLDHHVQREQRTRLGETAWFCEFAQCDVAYFDLFERRVDITDLQQHVYPKSPDAPLCACFSFSMDDLEADIADGTPTRIRELLARSKSPEARCATLSPNGECCLREIQRLYFKRTAASDK